MILCKHFLIAILQGTLVTLSLLVQAQDHSGFISIDCGISDVSSYTDENTGIIYFSDANFTETGENRAISQAHKDQTDNQQLWNLRIFPQGIRNCYTLKPTLGKGSKYLIRASFKYGNYDDKDQAPKFDLYLGVDLWDTVKFEGSLTTIYEEIIHVPSSDHIHVCLVYTGYGTPFISALELRPLSNQIYISEVGSSLILNGRFDFSSATDRIMRYKDDVYDRFWSPLGTDKWRPFIRTNLTNEDSISKNLYGVPFTVMSTAYTQNLSSDSMNMFVEKLNSTNGFFLYMHFSELEKLQPNQSREFNIYINGKWLYGPVAPVYLGQNTVYSIEATKPDLEGKIDIWLNNTNRSTLPPLLNALEMYVLKELSRQETYQNDVEAISNVKMMYALKRIKWQGDPCAPETYIWDGLNCSYNADNPSRIISLNLSSSGLKGEIVPSIASLTMLQYLDLSNNNLNGTVPEFLAQLSFLKVLNLKGNKLIGPIPDALSERTKNGLLLSIDTGLSSTSCSSGSCGKRKTFVVPLVASLGGVLLICITTVAVVWSLRKRQRKSMNFGVDNVNGESNEEDGSFVSKKQQFAYSEIQRITNNFRRVLGQGGFGKVYHGYLNGNEVAVKMLSPSSVQGHRQFHAELKLLLRVHHKNLTTLVGYCKEGSNIGLIYEYMGMGNLRSHLSGSSRNILSWEHRLRIAIDTAQGLEYLHNGCKPPIVHRDVKSTNILLNKSFQAKLGDFGLSQVFPVESGNNSTSGITTGVVGTPGYVDPEYFTSNWLNEKSDVYSFGVVLMEIITARPVLGKAQENNHIIQWVSSMLAKGNVKSILDPKLEGGNFDINAVWKVIEISMACVSTTSTNRPTMSQVAIELKECLTTNITRKDGHIEVEYSKDSKNMVSEFSPVAR